MAWLLMWWLNELNLKSLLQSGKRKVGTEGTGGTWQRPVALLKTYQVNFRRCQNSICVWGEVYRGCCGRQYARKKSRRRQTHEKKIARRQTPVVKSSRRRSNGIPSKSFSWFRVAFFKSFYGLCLHDKIPPYNAKTLTKRSHLRPI